MTFTRPGENITIDLSHDLDSAFDPSLFNGYDFYFNIAARKLYEHLGSPQNTIIAVYPKNYPNQRRRMKEILQYGREVWEFKSLVPYYGNITTPNSQLDLNINVYGTLYIEGEVHTNIIADAIDFKVKKRLGKDIDDYTVITYLSKADQETIDYIWGKLNEYKVATRRKRPIGFNSFDSKEVRQC